MLAKFCLGSGVLVLIGLLSIAAGVFYSMAPDGGGRKVTNFMAVGFSSVVVGLLVGLSSLLIKLCLAIFT